MLARIVNRYLATHVDGEPACSGKVGISQIVLCASRSWNAQICWPPIAELCAGHEEARPVDATAALLLIPATQLALPAALGLALALDGHCEQRLILDQARQFLAQGIDAALE